jgi:hypothetical protein
MQVMSSKRLVAIFLVATAGCVGVWLQGVTTGQAADATVTVELTSTPPLEHLRPNHDLARVTLTPLLHGSPLSHGHLRVRLTAPPPTQVLSTGFPRVEGTLLLALDSDLTDGIVSVQYRFPIRGTYTFDLDISPVPGGPVFQPTSLRKTVRIYEDSVVMRHAWLLIIGLFVLGGLTGVILSRSAAAQERLLSCVIIGPLVLLCSMLAPVRAVSASAEHTTPEGMVTRGHQVVHGDKGWALAVHASPVPATVGHVVQLAIELRKDGELFPGLMEVALEVVNQEEAHVVLETHILARQGQTSQSLQCYDGTLHTVTVTVRPIGEAESGVAPLTAVLGLDVVALHPPMAVKLRMMALLLGVLVGGMVVGFFVPWSFKERAGA